MHRRSKKSKETSGKSHKSRSLSELVELVSSGAIQIPQSLMAYAEDKSQLLDQIFTILGSDDIQDMLPDPLKVCQSCWFCEECHCVLTLHGLGN